MYTHREAGTMLQSGFPSTRHQPVTEDVGRLVGEERHTEQIEQAKQDTNHGCNLNQVYHQYANTDTSDESKLM